MAKVKFKFASTIEKLIFELDNRFSFHELMNAFGMLYPQH
jgi:hypothetical protein